MKSTLTKIFTPIITIALSTLGITPAFAVGDVCSSSASAEVKKAAGCSGSGDDLPNVIVNILNAIILVAGFVSVIWIIIGGVTYMTSAGDSGKVKKGRDTILYACIGLVVCVLAFAIVNFVILNVLNNA